MTMSDYTPQELYRLRQWYGKLDLRYSGLYLGLAHFFVPKNVLAVSFLLLMFATALISHIQ